MLENANFNASQKACESKIDCVHIFILKIAF